MAAGKLDRRITLQRATYEDDGFTSAGKETWSDIATVWASAIPINDSERWRSHGVDAVAIYRFTIRYSSTVADIGAADRVMFDGDEYNIIGVKEVGRRKQIEITAKARVE